MVVKAEAESGERKGAMESLLRATGAKDIILPVLLLISLLSNNMEVIQLISLHVLTSTTYLFLFLSGYC